ncbi:MAG: NgoFVII family restriction endonuclease [Flavobacterium sp.]|jgi:hypothetical protein|nr:NgoFVII family restriction endonuclease [Flavobacterium sp.]
MNIISTDLFEKALVEPIKQGANKLCIVSGYATATMAIRHIEYVQRELNKNFALKIIVGMCPQDGIQRSQHLGFQKLQNDYSDLDFECGYIVNRPPVHSKVYAWLRNNEPMFGFVGSANYTKNAFSSSMREVLVNKNASDCFNYFKYIEGQSVNCTTDGLTDLISIFERQPKQQTIENVEVENDSNILGDDKVILTLLDKRTNDVPLRSGLNWGQRPEYGRNPNQAYINIPAEIGRSGFFPERFEPFMVLTDDNKELICVRAQDNGKGLHTTLNNSHMGEYFRYRLGLPSGAFVTKADLLRYGRTDVDFYKIDDETYYMDFSVKQ